MTLEIIGLIGLIILVAVFLLQVIGLFARRKLLFYLLNAVGAGLLAYYAGMIQNTYFAILETIWCAGAAVSFGGNLFRSHRKANQIR